MPHVDEKRKVSAQIYGPKEPGDLAYLLSIVVEAYLASGDINYQRLNDVVGALDNLKFEFQRRFVAEYEDHKIEENGDAFEALQKRLDEITCETT